MASQTITAMFETRAEADRAAATIREHSSLATTHVKVLPETEAGMATEASAHPHHHEGGFIATLRNFFMPEEDRYGYAEGMRRGSYMVAVDADETEAHQVMDILEQAGAVDMEAEEARWRQEGWRGYESGSATTATAYDDTATQPALETTGTTSAAGLGNPPRMAATAASPTARPSPAGALTGGETEERIPLVEESLRVGKRQVVEGRVRIRSYIVETPVEETVRLRDEHVEVERRPVDRPVTGDGDPFRDREFEATESREEPVISKDARVREELVMRRTADERDETVRDTVRRTEVDEDRGDGTGIGPAGSARNPGAARTP